jgi:hypothetical protein
MDSEGRIGEILANHQFTYDTPPGQPGAIYTSDFSACANGSLAVGDHATFYQCVSGNFDNIYDAEISAQCEAVRMLD